MQIVGYTNTKKALVHISIFFKFFFLIQTSSSDGSVILVQLYVLFVPPWRIIVFGNNAKYCICEMVLPEDGYCQ